MLARFCPTVFVVEVLLDLALAIASFLRRRRVTVHLVVRRLSLALALQLELALRFPTRLWAVALACSLLPCLAIQDFAFGCQDLYQSGIRQVPRCAPRSLRPPSACMRGTATSQDRCVAPSIRPRSFYEMDRHELGSSCRHCILPLQLGRLQATSET